MNEASHYIAEIYVPRGSAVPEPWPDARVRSLWAFFVPEDETCLYVFEATSRDAVTEAGRCAGMPFDRVSAARLVRSVNQLGKGGHTCHV